MDLLELETYKSELLLEVEKATEREWKAEIMSPGLVILSSPPRREIEDGEMSWDDIRELESIFEMPVSKHGLIIPFHERRRKELLERVKDKN